MVENWKTCKVEDIADPNKGSTVTGPFGSSIGKKYWQASGIPIIRGNNIVFNGPDYIDENYIFISEDYYNSKMKRYTAITDDIIFTAAGTIGQVGIIPSNTRFPFYIVSNKQMRLRVNKNIVDPKFAFYYFRTKKLRQLIIANNTGSTIPLINLTVLRNLPFPLIPLAEQKQIASILSALDDKIELNLQMNKTLEEMAMALYKYWFVDFGPFQKRKFVDSELGLIPEGWEVKSIGDFSNILNAKRVPLSTRQRSTRKGCYPYYGASGIIDSIDDYKFDGEYVIISEDGENLRSRKTPIAFRAVGQFWVNNHAHILQGLEEGINELIICHFAQLDMTPFLTGAVQPKLNKQNLLLIKIPMPIEKSISNEVLVKLHSLSRVFVTNNEETQTLTSLRDTLLPKLISGEVRVKEAKALLAEALVN